MTSSTSKKLASAVILVLIAGGGIGVYLYQDRAVGDVSVRGDIPGKPQSISVDHYFDNGIHTFKGSITVPTPCHEIVSKVEVKESFPEQVSIHFTKEGASNFCAQVVSLEPFTVTFEASKDALVSVTLDGETVLFNVTEKVNLKKEIVIETSLEATSTTEVFDDTFLFEGVGTE